MSDTYDPMVFDPGTFDARNLPFDSAFDDVVFDADRGASGLTLAITRGHLTIRGGRIDLPRRSGGTVVQFRPNPRDEDAEIIEISVRALRMLMWRR